MDPVVKFGSLPEMAQEAARNIKILYGTSSMDRQLPTKTPVVVDQNSIHARQAKYKVQSFVAPIRALSVPVDYINNKSTVRYLIVRGDDRSAAAVVSCRSRSLQRSIDRFQYDVTEM
jgi:hypothetical protein